MNNDVFIQEQNLPYQAQKSKTQAQKLGIFNFSYLKNFPRNRIWSLSKPFADIGYIYLHANQSQMEITKVLPNPLSENCCYIYLGNVSDLDIDTINAYKRYQLLYGLTFHLNEMTGELAFFKQVNDLTHNFGDASLDTQCLLAKLDMYVRQLPFSGRMHIIDHIEIYDFMGVLESLKEIIEKEVSDTTQLNTTAIIQYLSDEKTNCFIHESSIKNNEQQDPVQELLNILQCRSAALTKLLSSEKEGKLAKVFWAKLALLQHDKNMALAAYHFFESIKEEEELVAETGQTQQDYEEVIKPWQNTVEFSINEECVVQLASYHNQLYKEGNWGWLENFMTLFSYTQPQKKAAVRALIQAINFDEIFNFSDIDSDKSAALFQGKLGEIFLSVMDKSYHHYIKQSQARSGFYFLRKGLLLQSNLAKEYCQLKLMSLQEKAVNTDNLKDKSDYSEPKKTISELDEYHYKLALYEASAIAYLLPSNHILYDELIKLFSSSNMNFHRLLHDDLLDTVAKARLIQQFMLPKLQMMDLEHRLLQLKYSSRLKYEDTPLGSELLVQILPMLQWTNKFLTESNMPLILNEAQKINLFCNFYKPLLKAYLKDKNKYGEFLIEVNNPIYIAVFWHELLIHGLEVFNLTDSDYGIALMNATSDLCLQQRIRLSYQLNSSVEGLGFEMGISRQLESITTTGVVLKTADVKLREQMVDVGQSIVIDGRESLSAALKMVSTVGLIGIVIDIIDTAYGMPITNYFINVLSLTPFIEKVASLKKENLERIPEYIKTSVKAAYQCTEKTYYSVEKIKDLSCQTIEILTDELEFKWPSITNYFANKTIDINQQLIERLSEAKNKLSKETLYVALSDILSQVSPVRGDAVSLIVEHYSNIYEPVISRLQSSEAYILGNIWFGLMLDGLHTYLSLVEMGEEEAYRPSSFEQLFDFLDGMLWRFTSISRFDQTLLMTIDGRAVPAMSLIFPEQLLVASKNNKVTIFIQPSCFIDKPKGLFSRCSIYRHASKYEFEIHQKLTLEKNYSDRSYGFSVKPSSNSEEITPSFQSVINFQVQVDELLHTQKIHTMLHGINRYEKGIQAVLEALRQVDRNKVDIEVKLKNVVNKLSTLYEVLQNTIQVDQYITSVTTLYNWHPFDELSLKENLYQSILSYLNKIECLLVLLDRNLQLSVHSISFYPSQQLSQQEIIEKVESLGDEYPFFMCDSVTDSSKEPVMSKELENKRKLVDLGRFKFKFFSSFKEGSLRGNKVDALDRSLQNSSLS